jgi:hypothetical protein
MISSPVKLIAMRSCGARNSRVLRRACQGLQHEVISSSRVVERGKVDVVGGTEIWALCRRIDEALTYRVYLGCRSQGYKHEKMRASQKSVSLGILLRRVTVEFLDRDDNEFPWCPRSGAIVNPMGPPGPVFKIELSKPNKAGRDL